MLKLLDDVELELVDEFELADVDNAEPEDADPACELLLSLHEVESNVMINKIEKIWNDIASS